MHSSAQRTHLDEVEHDDGAGSNKEDEKEEVAPCKRDILFCDFSVLLHFLYLLLLLLREPALGPT